LAALRETAPGQFALTGDLDLASVPALVGEGRRLGKGEAPLITIDLSGVGRSSSAAVALLLEWSSQASRAGTRLRFIHWPDAMARIAALCSLDGLLGTDGPPSEILTNG
jgi:phospholipid transport system transporter-binding protein